MSRIQDGIRNVKKAQKKGALSDDSTSPKVRKISRSNLDLRPGRFATLDADLFDYNRIINDNFTPDAVTPYKILRTRVLQKMDKEKWRILAVTSAHERAGKTITAINLAITIAQSGDRPVFLLDFDLRKPGVAKSLRLEQVDGGLGEYLSGKSKLKEILWNVGIDHLVVVPGTARFENSSDLLTSTSMSALMDAIISDPEGPILIIDLPPVLVTDDALAVAPMADCLLFVVAEGETKRADVLHSFELLKDVEFAGVVLNKSHDPHPGY